MTEANLPLTEDGRVSDIVKNSPDVTANPERQTSAAETLASIEAVFQDDPQAIQVIVGMASGNSPKEIQEEVNMNSMHLCHHSAANSSDSRPRVF